MIDTGVGLDCRIPTALVIIVGVVIGDGLLEAGKTLTVGLVLGNGYNLELGVV